MLNCLMYINWKKTYFKRLLICNIFCQYNFIIQIGWGFNKESQHHSPKIAYGSWCILLSLLETFVHLLCQNDKGKQILNVEFFCMVELCVFFPEHACWIVLSLLCRFSCTCEVGRSRHNVDKLLREQMFPTCQLCWHLTHLECWCF